MQRVELGEHLVQGTDYAYTLQGWLKGINGDRLNPTTDMGRDGMPPWWNPNLLIGRDAYRALTLSYYGDDYCQRDDSPLAAILPPNALRTLGRRHEHHAHPALQRQHRPHREQPYSPSGCGMAPTATRGRCWRMVYRYDQLNRLRASYRPWH